jgi:hypothetical protein
MATYTPAQIELLKSLPWESIGYYYDRSSETIAGYMFVQAYFYGPRTETYTAVVDEAICSLAFIPTDKGEAFACNDWFDAFKKAGTPPDRASIARAAYAIPEGVTSKPYIIRLPDDSAHSFDALNPAQRGEVVKRGCKEFPWEHYELLCVMHGAIEEQVRD